VIISYFADRDGRHGGDYTHLARIDHATILDEETAAAFTNAIGWGEVSDVSYQHVMFRSDIRDDARSRGFWETLGFRGWPNDTFSGIDFGRSGSTFFAEYDSIEAFLEQIRGNKIYPTELAVETESADEYETLEAAITDIRSRLEESSENTSGSKPVLGKHSSPSGLLHSLDSNRPVPSPRALLQRSINFDPSTSYSNPNSRRLPPKSVSAHYSFSPAKTLFLCWVRILQEEVDDTGSVLSQPRLNSILRDTYTVETDTETEPVAQPIDSTHPVLSHIERRHQQYTSSLPRVTTG